MHGLFINAEICRRDEDYDTDRGVARTYISGVLDFGGFLLILGAFLCVLGFYYITD